MEINISYRFMEYFVIFSFGFAFIGVGVAGIIELYKNKNKKHEKNIYK